MSQVTPPRTYTRRHSIRIQYGANGGPAIQKKVKPLRKSNVVAATVATTNTANKYSHDNLDCFQCNAARTDETLLDDPEGLETIACASSWLTHITTHCDSEGFARSDCANCKDEHLYRPNTGRYCSGYANNFGNPMNCQNIQFSLSDRCSSCGCSASWHPKCAYESVFNVKTPVKTELPACPTCRTIAADMIKHYGPANYYPLTTILLAKCLHSEKNN